MSIPAFCAARMIVSPGSKGISRSSILKVGIRFSENPNVRTSVDLAVALATNHVQRAEAGYDVGHHGTGDDSLETRGDQEARRADAHAVGRPAAVAHQVEAELAIAALGVRIHLAGGQFEALHHDLEV